MSSDQQAIVDRDREQAAAASSSDDRERFTWDEFGGAARELAADVVAAGFRADIVVAIARGGLLLGGAIAYALGVKSCGSLNVEFYTGLDERLAEPEILPPLLDGAALVGKRVLLVDDVSDSGRTLALAVDILGGMGADVRSVCLYTKPHTVKEPDFTWRTTDRWIVFPWSALPPVAGGAAAPLEA